MPSKEFKHEVVKVLQDSRHLNDNVIVVSGSKEFVGNIIEVRNSVVAMSVDSTRINNRPTIAIVDLASITAVLAIARGGD